MLVYLLLDIVILLFTMVLLFKKQEKYSDKIYLWGIGIILIFVSGFRGNFTSDYSEYANLFHYFNNFTITEIFNINFDQEIGYVILNKIIGVFTQNSVYLMLITSAIIIITIFEELRRESVYIWLSVLMFVTIGSYYTSFNLTRQIIAAGIVFLGSKYLYERNFLRYTSILLLASTFHKSALIMIIFYFILNYRFKIKNLLVSLFALFIIMNSLESIISLVQKYSYTYYTLDSYGMAGYNYKNIILPLSLLLFSIIHYSKLDRENSKVNIWINAIVFYCFFSILGLKIQLIQRIAEYFALYALLIVPYIISKIENKDLKRIYIFIIIIFLVLYNYITLSGTGYDPYYFIWSGN